METSGSSMTNGRAAAAVVSGGIGCLSLGFFSTLGESSQAAGRILNFYNPVGNLTGKTIMSVVVWFISWAILDRIWKNKEVNFGKWCALALVMVGLGFLGTFPPFFDFIGQ